MECKHKQTAAKRKMLVAKQTQENGENMMPNKDGTGWNTFNHFGSYALHLYRQNA